MDRDRGLNAARMPSSKEKERRSNSTGVRLPENIGVQICKGEKAAGWGNAVLLSAVWCSLLSLHPEEKVEPQARLLVLKRQSAAFGAGIEPGPESFKSI